MPWLLGAGLASLAPHLLAPRGGAPAAALRSVLWALLALASAEDAKRRLDVPRGRASRAARSWVSCPPPVRGKVDLRIEVAVDRPLASVWRQVADLPTFLQVDPFHDRVIPLAPRLEPGTGLVLVHVAFGFRFLRSGRLLRWREGEGYAFSDLSARGPGRGFPHVFLVNLEPFPAGSGGGTRLSVRVKGRWTARAIPPCLARLWLRFTCLEHARLLERALSAG